MKLIKFLILVFLIGLLVCPLIFAQEVIVSYELDSLPVLNHELDRTRERLRAIEDDSTVDLTDEVVGILPLANGGTGNALVDPDADRIGFYDNSAETFTWLTIGTNLSITGTTLNNDISLSGLSNVVFNWSGPAYGNEWGLYYGKTLGSDLSSGTDLGNGILGVHGNTYREILYFKYKHTDEISTITIHAKVATRDASGNGTYIKVDIGGQNNYVADDSTTLVWATTSNITVSGLTDGETYAGVISIKNDGYTPSGFCSAITLIAN